MRKILIVAFLALISIALVSGYAYAITGQCGTCHTMHNSQDGSAVDSDGPNANLTKFACLGCHSGSVSGAPDLFQQLAANRTAAGTFNDTVIDNDNKVHNVVDLGAMLGESTESVITATPGNTGSNIILTPTQLNCAGATGCHGDHTQAGSSAGIKGYHHNSPSKGYRFLETADGTPVNINGLKSSTWELGGATTANHNVYDADGNDSISNLCAQCHGGFHGSANTNSTSPFVRHPTDEEAVIDNLVDAQGHTTFTPNTTQVNETPFGFSDSEISGMATTDMTGYTTEYGSAVCVSCHRAHGSENADLLRFNYGSMSAGDGTDDGGCETCHVSQQ